MQDAPVETSQLISQSEFFGFLFLIVNRGTAMLSTPVETTFVQIGVKVFDYYFVSDVLGNLQFSHHRL